MWWNGTERGKMSTESAKKKMHGHGRVICRKCGKVIITCKCMECGKNIKYDTCDACEAQAQQ